MVLGMVSYEKGGQGSAEVRVGTSLREKNRIGE